MARTKGTNSDSKNKHGTGTKSDNQPVRVIDRYFAEFDSWSQHSGNRSLQYLFIPIFSFAVLGLIWMIPFPEIQFLKKHGYDIFLNWASIFIAIVIYYYLKLVPTLSYAVLVSIGVMSYFIVQLEYWEQRGGPAVWIVCLALLILSFAVLWIGHQKEEKPAPFTSFLKLLAHGPIWLWHFAFKSLKLPY